MELMTNWVSPLAQFNWEFKRDRALEKGKKPPAMPRPRPTWRIKTEPHIGMVMKRLFPSLATQMGTYHLAHTPENARNLAWFMQRYPMKVRPAATLFDEAKRHREAALRLKDLFTGTSHPAPNAARLRSGFDWWPLQLRAAEAGHIRGRMILGDAVGLGKSGSSILGLMKQGRFPAVVVTLTSLPPQWELEAVPKFTEGLTTHIIRQGTPYDLRERRGRGRQPKTPGPVPDIILISYSKLAGWAEQLVDMGVKDLVFDEVQELRGGEDVARWEAAHHLSVNAERVLGNSATPFYNYGDEFWNVAEVVSPGELGTREEFSATWCTTNEAGKKVIKDSVAFGTYLRESGLMLRRTRAEADRELPGGDPLRIVQHVNADHKALERMSGDLAALARAILKDTEDFRGQKLQASGQFDMKMRQACGISKAPFVAEFVKLLLESEEKIVLYGHHRECYSIWGEALMAYNPVMYTGSESIAQKRISKRMFEEGGSRVLMLANRAGAGLDGLQKVCNICVIGELDWSPGVIEQMIGRLARDGQEKRVLAYFAIADTIADRKMADTLGVKSEQIEGVRDLKRGIFELQNDGGHIRAMAEEYLRSKGYPV
jgi:SNF2 family DNA or RNA helicase